MMGMSWNSFFDQPFSSLSLSQSSLPVVNIGNVALDGVAPLFILGPCAIESEEAVWDAARSIKKIADELRCRFVFKASYDKANRTSIKSYRGPGIDEGCRILGEIGKELGVPVTTDVHTAEEAEKAAQHIDLLQIPAFLCRQTDLIVAAGGTGRAVSVKKGQFLAPWDVVPIAGKLEEVGCENFFFIERGSSFGYGNLVADMRSLYWIREKGYRVVFDATHSVQRPGGLGDRTGGDGILAPVLARSAVSAGCDGVFMESHPDPENALSDGPNQVPLSDLSGILETLQKLHDVVTK